MEKMSNTQYFKVAKEPEIRVADVISEVYEALTEKGYNPVSQIVGYIMSGDPTYITTLKNSNTRAVLLSDRLYSSVRKGV